MCKIETNYADAQYELDIYPAFKSNNIPVVFETSRLFLPYLGVAIQSIVDKSTVKYNYDIVILSAELISEDCKKLELLSNGKANISIRVFDPTNLVSRYIETAKYQYLTLNYYRMSLPWILKWYKRVINLGADVLIKRDIGDLFYAEIDCDAYIGGVVDIGYQGRLALDISTKELGLKKPDGYVNADVLLLNLENIRKSFEQEAVMQSWQARFFRCAEQDAMNCLFQDHIHHFDPRWNVFPERMSSEFDVLHAPARSIEIWKQSLDDPYIIHYAALPKPWQLPSVGFGSDWWCTAKRTPYFEEILQNMILYMRENIPLDAVNTGSKGISDRWFPRGSLRRTFITLLVPKGSRRWCFLKKLQYKVDRHRHRCI